MTGSARLRTMLRIAGDHEVPSVAYILRDVGFACSTG